LLPIIKSFNLISRIEKRSSCKDEWNRDSDSTNEITSLRSDAICFAADFSALRSGMLESVLGEKIGEMNKDGANCVVRDPIESSVTNDRNARNRSKLVFFVQAWAIDRGWGNPH